MIESAQRLSIQEKIGYGLGDAAANFVFMTMVLFQANFYTDVMGIAAADRAGADSVPGYYSPPCPGAS
jgi:Na+/melibiose symporter-like transporter